MDPWWRGQRERSHRENFWVVVTAPKLGARGGEWRGQQHYMYASRESSVCISYRDTALPWYILTGIPHLLKWGSTSSVPCVCQLERCVCVYIYTHTCTVRMSVLMFFRVRCIYIHKYIKPWNIIYHFHSWGDSMGMGGWGLQGVGGRGVGGMREKGGGGRGECGGGGGGGEGSPFYHIYATLSDQTSWHLHIQCYIYHFERTHDTMTIRKCLHQYPVPSADVRGVMQTSPSKKKKKKP